jgi:hypothetical protein
MWVLLECESNPISQVRTCLHLYMRRSHTEPDRTHEFLFRKHEAQVIEVEPDVLVALD